jgi:hypothetical protein
MVNLGGKSTIGRPIIVGLAMLNGLSSKLLAPIHLPLWLIKNQKKRTGKNANVGNQWLEKIIYSSTFATRNARQRDDLFILTKKSDTLRQL